MQDPRSRTPPTNPTGPIRRPKADSPLESYHRVADTIGGVPNLRLKDNVVQTVVIVGGTLLGAAAGAVIALIKDTQSWALLTFAGAAIGMIVCFFVSGFVLMILGWVRTLKPRR